MAEYTISKIKLPNGDICNIKDTNTWRGIQDNLTSSSNTTESLSAKQGYLLANGSARDNTKLPLAGGTLTGALTTANNTWNVMGDDAYFGDINKAGHIGIKGKNGNTGLFFVTYNQSSNTTGGAITWDGTKFSITSTTAIDASISGSAGSVALSGVTGADDLKAIEALSGTSGFLKKTAANTWSLDTNTYLTSSTGVTSIAGKTGAVTLADLGLSNAMHFAGTTTTVMSDGLATANVTINNSTYTPKNGDVVLYSDSEYVWTGSTWERLGRDSSFKTTQTAKSDPQASTTTSTTFIDTISQDANGVITATKKTLPSYVPTSAGVTAVTWDSTNKKLTRTINGSAADVVTIGTIKTDLSLVKGDVGLGNVDNTADANKTVKYANMLTGMSSRNSTMTWGNQTGTVITCLASSGGGAWGFRDNNPASGQMSMTIDGTIYIKEGNQDISAAVKSFSVSGQTVTYTNLWGGTGTFTTQDTKNTAGSTNSTSKLFLIGATSQAANPTTNSYQYTYTNNGLLSALKLGLNLNGTEKAHLEWNDIDQSIDFIFN